MKTHTPTIPRPPLRYRLMMAAMLPIEMISGASCRTFARLDSERLLRALGAVEWAFYWMHRMMCGVCRRHARTMEVLRTQIREIDVGGGHDPGCCVPEDARDRIRRALARELRRRDGCGGAD